MKKILYITRPITPPWDEASKNFAYFLAKNGDGFEFNVLTPGKASIESHIIQHPIYSSAHLDWNQRLRMWRLFLLAKNFDILHFMLTPTKLNSFLFRMISFFSKAKTIQTIATLREDLFSENELKQILFADKIITYSDYAKIKLENMGFENIERIYPGIDLEKYSPTPKDSETLSAFELSASDFVIMYPGEYVRLGATDYIVDLLPELFEKLPNSKFIFGCRIKNDSDRKKKDEVVEKLKSKNILEKVVFTDTFSDMPKLYNISDAVIFPVLNMHGKFDVPLAVIEAFACEKPVIISDIPILQEFAKTENSIIIKNGNTEQLIDELCDLYKNPSKRTLLGKSARKYAQENFDIKNVSSLYKKEYNNLL